MAPTSNMGAYNASFFCLFCGEAISTERAEAALKRRKRPRFCTAQHLRRWHDAAYWERRGKHLRRSRKKLAAARARRKKRAKGA